MSDEERNGQVASLAGPPAPMAARARIPSGFSERRGCEMMAFRPSKWGGESSLSLVDNAPPSVYYEQSEAEGA